MAQVSKLVVGGIAYDLTDPGKLPLPQSGAVGQVIVVTAADDTGTVTATGAVDPQSLLPDGDEVVY